VEINIGKKVISAEIKALDLLKKSISRDFSNAIEVLFKTKGKIIISGLGKVGILQLKSPQPFLQLDPHQYFCIRLKLIMGILE
jgi:D-arabinose 5-phosphate isomerase GutQ